MPPGPMPSPSRTPSRASSRLGGLATLLLALLAPAPRAEAQQLAVDQIEIYLTSGDPTRSSAVFNVSNEGDRALQATLYMSDWDRDSTGNNRFFPVGTMRESCKGVLQVFPSQMRLEPHSQQAVRVTLSGSEAQRAACWSVVFVELQDPVRLQQAGRAVQAVIRVGTKIYVDPANVLRTADVSDMRLARHVAAAEETAAERADTTRRDLVILLKNTGGTQLRPNGRVEVRRPDNSVVTTVRVEEFPILPGAVRRLAIPLPTLAPGKYVALTLLDYGGAEIAGGQVEFEIP
jgi:P pilus assembly chaperone PapD